MKRSSIIAFSIISAIVIIAGCVTLFYISKTRNEKLAIKAKSEQVLSELNSLLINPDYTVNTIKEKYDLLASEYYDTEAFYTSHALMYSKAEEVYKLLKKCFEDTKNPDMDKALYYYNILSKIYNGFPFKGYADMILETRSSEIYKNLYEVVADQKNNVALANKLYDSLKKYYSTTKYKIKADELMANPEKVIEMVKFEEAAQASKWRNEAEARQKISIGDPESKIDGLYGVYEKTTSEYGSSKTNHYYGRKEANYKYITATNGKIDYISY